MGKVTRMQTEKKKIKETCGLIVTRNEGRAFVRFSWKRARNKAASGFGAAKKS